ncbi:hypothetical protein PYW07_001653 [Mythimna separata]|uniref:Pyruvate kinase C-terminal domain-containing protein n=1 Tax=Mythimna separata TaxID=271217 RepID=A0AAD8DX58_MYTSE|nr:hypothetical protein PYW07_001653 [Mythimna separata]
MVWWMHFNPEKQREGIHFGLKSLGDVFYQTISIMYDCHENYDGYNIHCLTNVGVNIFNIDMTKHNTEYFNAIRDAMASSASMPEMIPCAYYTPVALSVTMSVNDPIDVDDRVDIIILKDVTSIEQLRQFKKDNIKTASMPILFWPPTLKLKDLNQIIKITAGIVLDPKLDNIFGNFDGVLTRCREDRKPIFYMDPTLIDDYYKEIASDRKLLIQVHDLIKHRLDGVFLMDVRRGEPPIECIQAFIKATEIIEKDYVAVVDYFKLSLPLKLPVLQPYAVALAASIAALQCGASAIIVLTTTGSSAKILSCACPPCKVIAVTRHEKTARRMHLFRKVLPLHYRHSRFGSWQDESMARIAFGTQFGLDTGLFNIGAKLVVLAPSEEGVVYCNSFQIFPVKHILHRFECGRYDDNVEQFCG